MVDVRRHPTIGHIAWHALVTGTILVVPAGIVFKQAFWDLPGTNPWLVLGLAGAYLVTVVALEPLALFFQWPRSVSAVAVGALGVAGVFFLGLMLSQPNYSRLMLGAGAALVAAAVLSLSVLQVLPQRLLHIAVGFAAFVLVLTFSAEFLTAEPGVRPQRRTQILRASQHVLSATYYAGYLPASPGTRVDGGAITPDPGGAGFFLVRPKGEIYKFSWDERDVLAVVDQHLRVPINNADFEAQVPDSVSKSGFRVADLLAIRDGRETTLFASHHYWKRKEGCFVVRVSSIVLAANGEFGKPAQHWTTAFESTPCLAIEAARGAAFAGEQMGGNLEYLGAGKVLLTVGDHQFDGWYRERNLVQDPDASYGKTILIDTTSGHASLFTLGHRNPQGLVVEANGVIWSTEHGPQGGDELNVLRPGANYGYPYETYGTEYGGVTWPHASDAPASADYTRPVFAWVPSIGISDLVVVTSPAFERWTDDLMISSLANRAIWRIRRDGLHVAYSEPIDIGERVRDIADAGTGEIVLWTDSEALVRIRPAENLNDGAALFTLQCGGCHDDSENRIGPTLRGVFDRAIASSEGYGYSAALEDLRGRWTNERLDEFLADPASFVPGTTMVIDGVEDPDARSQIVAYLRYSN